MQAAFTGATVFVGGAILLASHAWASFQVPMVIDSDTYIGVMVGLLSIIILAALYTAISNGDFHHEFSDVTVNRIANELVAKADSREEPTEEELANDVFTPTKVERLLVALFKARHGLQTYTAANLKLVRREMCRLLGDVEHFPTINHMRKVDFERHVQNATMLAFIPTITEVQQSRIFISRSGLVDWLLGRPKNKVQERLESYVKPGL